MNNHHPSEDYYSYYQYYQPKQLKIFNKLRGGKPKINVILFFATYISTFLTGWFQHGNWQAGVWYSTSIISILLAHEMGHYLMCRKYGIQATLPYFLPMPVLSPFGTFGAVIKMESRIPSRRALFDVAVAGPLAGLAVTLPCIYYGLKFSQIITISPDTAKNTYFLGESLLFSQISKLAIGTLPEGKDVLLHPMAFAGWAGLFVTALNLLPIGQLDGGHIVYALLGRNHNYVATVALITFGFITIFIYPGWIVLLLLLIWFGYKHPPTLDETPLDEMRVAIGVLTLIIFVLSFTPEPFKF